MQQQEELCTVPLWSYSYQETRLNDVLEGSARRENASHDLSRWMRLPTSRIHQRPKCHAASWNNQDMHLREICGMALMSSFPLPDWRVLHRDYNTLKLKTLYKGVFCPIIFTELLGGIRISIRALESNCSKPSATLSESPKSMLLFRRRLSRFSQGSYMPTFLWSKGTAQFCIRRRKDFF